MRMVDTEASLGEKLMLIECLANAAVQLSNEDLKNVIEK